MPLECARLTRLSLTRVQLLSESFSCNLHSLEELKLDQCSGIREFKLSSRSMKRLYMNNISRHFKATIDAPSIVSFVYEGILPRSISFAGPTTSSSDELWKSKIILGSSTYDHKPAHCFRELYSLLDPLRQSEISLELDQIDIRRFRSQLNMGDHIVGVSEEAKQLPVVVEHLTIRRPERNVNLSAAFFFNRLFHVFRPSFIYMGRDMLTDSSFKRRSHEIVEILFKKRETAISFFRQRLLEGVGLQVKYRNRREWQPIYSIL